MGRRRAYHGGSRTNNNKVNGYGPAIPQENESKTNNAQENPVAESPTNTQAVPVSPAPASVNPTPNYGKCDQSGKTKKNPLPKTSGKGSNGQTPAHNDKGKGNNGKNPNSKPSPAAPNSKGKPAPAPAPNGNTAPAVTKQMVLDSDGLYKPHFSEIYLVQQAEDGLVCQLTSKSVYTCEFEWLCEPFAELCFGDVAKGKLKDSFNRWHSFTIQIAAQQNTNILLKYATDVGEGEFLVKNVCLKHGHIIGDTYRQGVELGDEQPERFVPKFPKGNPSINMNAHYEENRYKREAAVPYYYYMGEGEY